MKLLTPSAARLRFLPRVVIEDRCAPAFTERIIGELEPYLRMSASSIAMDLPAALDDMIQEARITIWELDLGRFRQRDLPYLKRSLRNRMVDVLCTEGAGGLTTGWSKHEVP